MTDQEKLEFLLKALEENGWMMSDTYKKESKRGLFFENHIGTKKGVRISIECYPELDEIMLFFNINEMHVSAVDFTNCEVFLDRIEFLYNDTNGSVISVMVRFSDAYVLIGYEPKESAENNG